MTQTASEVITRLNGRTLVTAESLTGGGIGAALTAVPGASAVFKGGVICYTNQVKQEILGVPEEILNRFGAVSPQTAEKMAIGAKKCLKSDFAIAVTGLAGPGGDDFGHSVGTVFMGFAREGNTEVRECHFSGDREAVRSQTVQAALQLVLEML